MSATSSEKPSGRDIEAQRSHVESREDILEETSLEKRY